jgi:DNA topoisomerase I
MPRLRRVDCSGPGIARRRRGRGFEYVDQTTGEKIADAEVLQRIKELAIPPAWKDVWICAYPMGHIQAVGTDDAGRKQYIYHARWRELQDREKFDEMLDFARSLPAMRKRWLRDASQRGFPREKVLACAARLLDRSFFRIGTEGYAEQNNSYGLATIRKSHVSLGDGVVTFDYRAKGGKRQLQEVVDESIYEIVSALKRRRGGGPELLAYKVSSRWVDVKSADINAYIKETSGSDFSAKDFRTWNATVLAAVSLAVSHQTAASKTARKRAMTLACKDVAHYLGNTPAIVRSSYIDPRVFDRFQTGWTILPSLEQLGEDAQFGELSTQGAIEAAVIDLIEDRQESDALERVA